MALRREIVDLVRLCLLHDADEVRGVRQVTVVEVETRLALVRVDVQVIDAAGIERRGATLDAMNLVTLAEQKLREVGAILTSDACDECDLAHALSED